MTRETEQDDTDWSEFGVQDIETEPEEEAQFKSTEEMGLTEKKVPFRVKMGQAILQKGKEYFTGVKEQSAERKAYQKELAQIRKEAYQRAYKQEYMKAVERSAEQLAMRRMQQPQQQGAFEQWGQQIRQQFGSQPAQEQEHIQKITAPARKLVANQNPYETQDYQKQVNNFLFGSSQPARTRVIRARITPKHKTLKRIHSHRRR